MQENYRREVGMKFKEVKQCSLFSCPLVDVLLDGLDTIGFSYADHREKKFNGITPCPPETTKMDETRSKEGLIKTVCFHFYVSPF